MYDLAHELGELNINKVLELPIDIYRGWIIWMNKRNAEAKRRQ